MTTTTQRAQGRINIDHVSPTCTLISIFPGDFTLNTHPGENAPLQDWSVWKSDNGRWILSADGADYDSRAKRSDAVARALRLSGIAPADRAKFTIVEDTEF